jgi:peptidoglycan/xylan/chitin deacetylase (PgdA/CDA1 family)
MKRGLTLPVLAALAALVAVRPAVALPEPGGRMQPFILPQSDGSSFRWQPGTVTVFAFCAFWCDTWKTQSESLAAASKALHGLPVSFITISVDDRWTERARGKIPGTLLTDPGSAFSKSLGIDGIPYLLIVDAVGRIREAARGVTRAATIEQAVRGLLEGEPAPHEVTVYLVFDDFPSQARGATTDLDDRLLDGLRSAQAKTTFFCRGDHIAGSAEVVRRAAREGHSLQIHSWDHRADRPLLARCVQALQQTAAVTPTLYQAPGSAQFLRLEGEPLALTVVNPYDYLRPGASELVRRVVLAAKPGSVILLHAGVSETVEVLPEIIRALRARGFEFGVLE